MKLELVELQPKLEAAKVENARMMQVGYQCFLDSWDNQIL